ncbi:MAG: PepSY domain-containing protein [Myxococcales bacterium]|nr:PepSY domain-containing protein [Myxococcales bacterium]
MATKLSLHTIVLSIGAVALGALATACSSDASDGPAPFAVASPSLEAALAARTGSRIVTLAGAPGSSPHGFLAAEAGHPVVSANATSDELRGFLASFGTSLGLEERIEALPVKGEQRGAGGVTVRFGQVVPGTSVPVFDSSVVVGVREDGSFAFLENDTAVGLLGYDVRPVVTLDAATALAQARGSAQASVPTRPVLGVANDGQGPTLVYRVDVADPAGSRRVDIDAKTGEVLADGESDLHALAYAAASYYPAGRASVGDSTKVEPTDPRAKLGAMLECEVSQGRLVRDTRGGRLELFDLRGLVPIAATSLGGVIVADVDPSRGAKFAPGVAVDAQWNISRAASFFGTALAARFGRADGRVPVYVHGAFQSGAMFSPGLGAISISDGKFGTPDAKGHTPSYYPPAVAYDMMAHEYAHGMMYYGGLTAPTLPPALPADRAKATPRQLADEARFVEGRALHEGLADVFAASAKSALSLERPVRREVFQFGADARPVGAPAFRDHLHPRDADPDERSSQHASEPVPDGRDTAGRAYFRSGLVAHAWALMAYGSANETSHIGAQEPLGVSGAFYAFALGSRLVRPQSPSIADLAHATISTQLTQDRRTSASCAWAAVGVLTEAEVRAKYGAVCAHFDASACSLLPDGAYCNSKVPGTAYRCQNHQLAAAPNGCASGQYCQRVGGSFASPAKLVSGGGVACGIDRDPM